MRLSGRRLALALVLAACANDPAPGPDPGDEGPGGGSAADPRAGKVSPELYTRLAETGGPLTVIVTLDEQESEVAARLAIGDLPPIEAEPLLALRRDDYRVMKGRALSAPGIRIVHELVELPTSVIEVSSPEALEALAASPDVLSAQPEGSFQPQMAESVGSTGAYGAHSSWGARGSGVTVAVLDTGLDYGLPNFGACAAPAGACVHGACDTGAALASACDPCVTSICATNPACCSGTWDATCVAAVATTCSLSCNSVNPGADFDVEQGGGAVCAVAVARDFAPFDAHREDTTTQFRLHGTAVADVIHAMAPQAKIAALDVFREGSTSVVESDVLAALDWVLTNRTTYNIRVVNLSFGSNEFTAPCPTHNLAASIDALRAAGVLTVAASGNGGRTDAIMGPACVPSVLSVGAVRDYGPQVQPTSYACTDTFAYNGYVPCFSNVAPFLDIVAPGTQVLHSGFTVNDQVASSTSMAAAHASGAAALTAGAFSFETASDWHKRLQYGGYTATDPRTWTQYATLNAIGGVASCALGLDSFGKTFDFNGGSSAVAVDVVPATCQFQINNYYTNWVHIDEAVPPTEPPQGSCSHSLCETGVALTSSCSLPCSQKVCDYDPYCCNSSWDGICTGSSVATACAAEGYSCGSAGSATLTGPQTVSITVDPIYYARNAYLYFYGNGAYYSDYFSILQSFAAGPPQVEEFTINGDATYTTSPIAQISSTVTDGTAVEAMCLSSTPTCTAWQAYSSPKSFGLPAGDGTKTIYGKFRDDFGNESSFASDSIVLDRTAPVNGTLTATGTSGQVALTWTGFSDATSGLASYKLVYAVGNLAPASCATGTVLPLAAGTATTSFTHSGLTNGTFYAYRLCATDNAGKISTGAVAFGRPAPEYTPPTGTVTINADAAFTTSGTVTLTFAASDASGMGSVCVNQTGATCTAWRAYPTTSTMSYTLLAGAGQKTVYVWFRDQWNNTTVAATTDTIVLDVQQAAVSAVGSDGQITVRWATAAGTPPGTDGWYLNRSTSSMASCDVGTNVYQGPNNSYVDTVPNDGTLIYYRICIRAFAMLSAGREVSARAKPESAPPTGTVTISGTPAPGTMYVSSTAVSLAITATDASSGIGPIEMCVSNSTVCTAWEPLAATKAWTLATGSGTKTVRVFLRDVFYNTTTSVQAATDTIVLDTIVPTNGSLTATPSAGQVALSWAGVSDSLSGLAGYRLVAQPTTAPASCATGTVLVDYATSGAGTTATHSGLAAGSVWGYRLCARDNVGNTSLGATRTATVP